MSERLTPYFHPLEPVDQAALPDQVGRMSLRHYFREGVPLPAVIGCRWAACGRVTQLAELAAHGMTDIFLRQPVVGQSSVRVLAEWASLLRLSVSADSIHHVLPISKIIAQKQLSLAVWIAVRTTKQPGGITPEGVPDLVRMIDRLPGLFVEGIFSNAEGPTSRAEQTELERLARRLSSLGISGHRIRSHRETWKVPVGLSRNVTELLVPWEPGIGVTTCIIDRPQADRALVDLGTELMAWPFWTGSIRGHEQSALLAMGPTRSLVALDPSCWDMRIGQTIDLILFRRPHVSSSPIDKT